MDLATLIGLGCGIGCVLAGFLMEGGKIAALFVISAAIIVFGGAFGATMISFSLTHSKNSWKVMRTALFSVASDRLALLRQMVDLAKMARRSGILTLESEARKIENIFLRQAIQLVVDGNTPEMVNEILETEVEAMRARHKIGNDFFTAWGGYSPTLGVLGTVMGLIHMLESLDKPGSMGPAIATAFIATFYGVGFANLVLLPIAAKLKANSLEETTTYEMVIIGILSLQAGDNPRVVSTKMCAYLTPADKQRLSQEE